MIRFYDPDHHVIEVGESLQSVEEKKREEKMLRNKTIQYYDENALDYIKDTKEVDFLSNQNRFLERLTTGHCILDFGCGSGRDTAYFMQKGYQVEALDGSKELCVLASDFTGIEVEHCFFQEFDKKEKYDGIWACASLLHLSKSEMFDVFHSLKRALKVGGVLYVSFKYGEESRERKGRYFTDMTEQGLTRYVHLVSGLSILSTWISSDVRPDRLDEKWLNALIFREE